MPTELPNNSINNRDMSDTQLTDTVLSIDDAAIEADSEKSEQPNRFANSSMAHFKIVDILGKGGMGSVYKAKDLALERYVAIKMLRIAQDHQPMILAEARTISQFNHPNIVTVYDIARDENDNFIVMEWINGRPLNAVISPQGLPLKTLLAYAIQMVAALQCAHKQGIIHRDIKPQNIMVDGNGIIKMLDFGIATLQGERQEQTASGSPQYMSPEQTLGKVCDNRSDLFSLGIVLYEMLTGVKPFLGLNAHHIGLAITRGQYTSIPEVLNEQRLELQRENTNKKQQLLLQTLIGMIDTLLKVEPSERYATADDLAEELAILDRQVNHQHSWWHQQHWLTKAFIILPLISILGWSVRGVLFPPSTQELIERQLVDSKKIAFLPFDNISGDPVLQLFSDGIATMLSNDLAEVGYQQGDGSTWVLPISEIRKMNAPTVSEIYNEYGVDLVVTGSIQHMGSTRSVHLTLVNGKDGRVLKTQQLTLDANTLFATQTHVREQVMALLGWHIPENLAVQFAAHKPKLDGAYKHYLEGQGYLYRFDHDDNIQNSLNAFQAAIELEPSYGDAYVGLAQVRLGQFLKTNDISFLPLMADAVDQLEKIDVQHRHLSYLQGEIALKQGQYQQASQLFEQAIKLNPNFFKAYTSLSMAYSELENAKQAEQILQTAYQLMPNNNSIIVELGIFHYINGDYQQAIHYFDQLAQQAPNNYIAYLNISACYYLIGDIKQAIVAVKKSLAIKPEANGYANLGTYYFILKDYARAVESYEQMIALNDTDYVNWGNLADAYYFANNAKFTVSFNEAITLAEQALMVNPNNQNAIASLAYYYAYVDKAEKARIYGEKINDKNSGAEQFLVAAAYTRLGQNDVAIRYLKLAIDNQYSIAEIKSSPLFNSLKNEPDYQHLLGKN